MIFAREGMALTTAAQSPNLLVDMPAKLGGNLGTLPYLKITAETPIVTKVCGAILLTDHIMNIATFQFVQRLILRPSANGTRHTPFCRLNCSAKLPSATTPQQPRTSITSCSPGAVMSSQSIPILLILARTVCQLKQTQAGRNMPQPLLL